MRQKIMVIAIILVVIAGVTGVAIWQLSRIPAGPTAPFNIIDDLGRNVTITRCPPERVVSLSPSSTEILFALGIGDKVVGVDKYSNYPKEAENITKIGSFARISIEAVLALEPDLILASARIQQVVVEALEEPLRAINGSIVAIHPQNIPMLFADIILVGKITGQVDEAEALVNEMNDRIQEIDDKTQGVSRPRVYFESYFNGGYKSIGSESWINEVICKAGGINIFADISVGTVTTSDEAIFDANPEVIIIVEGAMSKSCGLTPEVIIGRPGWDQLSAVKHDQIYVVEGEPLTRSGPRVVDAIETLANLLHPELFGSG
jgi:iron complex transport system substrate-binding protein